MSLFVFSPDVKAHHIHATLPSWTSPIAASLYQKNNYSLLYAYWPIRGRINTLTHSACASLSAPRGITVTGLEKCVGSTGGLTSALWGRATRLQTEAHRSRSELVSLTHRLSHTRVWPHELWRRDYTVIILMKWIEAWQVTLRMSHFPCSRA